MEKYKGKKRDVVIENSNDSDSEKDEKLEEEFSDLEVFFRKEEEDTQKKPEKKKKVLKNRDKENSKQSLKDLPEEPEQIICDRDGCDKSFTGKSRRILYRRHVERVHLQMRGEVCPKCGQGFYEKRDLLRHIESTHENLRT